MEQGIEPNGQSRLSRRAAEKSVSSGSGKQDFVSYMLHGRNCEALYSEAAQL
jgi:hypothetical protein